MNVHVPGQNVEVSIFVSLHVPASHHLRRGTHGSLPLLPVLWRSRLLADTLLINSWFIDDRIDLDSIGIIRHKYNGINLARAWCTCTNILSSIEDSGAVLLRGCGSGESSVTVTW
jgi:hypothetical protein